MGPSIHAPSRAGRLLGTWDTVQRRAHHQRINAPAHSKRQRRGAAAEGRLRQHAAGIRHMQWGSSTDMGEGILRGLNGTLDVLAIMPRGRVASSAPWGQCVLQQVR